MMKKSAVAMSIKDRVASCLIIFFILSALLVFLLEPWWVLIVNFVEMMVFGIVFRKSEIPSWVFILSCILLIGLFVVYICCGENICPAILASYTQNKQDIPLIWQYRIPLILFGVFICWHISAMLYINFEGGCGIFYKKANIHAVGVLSCIGGLLIALCFINIFIKADMWYFAISTLIVGVIYAYFAWFIKRLIYKRKNDDGFWDDCDTPDYGSSKSYDVYIVERD